MKNTTETITETYGTIKLGIDAHAKWYYVARQLDGATPQPLQKMTFEGLLHFVAKYGISSTSKIATMRSRCSSFSSARCSAAESAMATAADHADQIAERDASSFVKQFEGVAAEADAAGFL